MIELDDLIELNCNVNEGLKRCLNNEAFYLKLVNKAIDEDEIKKLKDAICNLNYEKIFEISHALKGIYSNLELTPLIEITKTICENARINANFNYLDSYDKLENNFNKFLEYKNK